MNRLDKIEEGQLRNNIPQFQPGDTVRVHVRIKESETKERLQAFEGVVIARKHGGARETITVRKTSFGVGVERLAVLHPGGLVRVAASTCDSVMPSVSSPREIAAHVSGRQFASAAAAIESRAATVWARSRSFSARAVSTAASADGTRAPFSRIGRS